MSWLKPLRKILTLRCKEATLLDSRSLDEPLGLAERLALRGHQLSCAPCRRFARQVRFLHAALRRRAENDPASDHAEALSPQARERIERVLIRAAGEDDAKS